MNRLDLAQKVLDEMEELNSNKQLTHEEREKREEEFKKSLEELQELNAKLESERIKEIIVSEKKENNTVLDKLAAELEEVKEQLIAIEKEKIENTSYFGLLARVRRLEQLLATNAQDIKTCWDRLSYLEREIGRLK